MINEQNMDNITNIKTNIMFTSKRIVNYVRVLKNGYTEVLSKGL